MNRFRGNYPRKSQNKYINKQIKNKTPRSGASAGPLPPRQCICSIVSVVRQDLRNSNFPGITSVSQDSDPSNFLSKDLEKSLKGTQFP